MPANGTSMSNLADLPKMSDAGEAEDTDVGFIREFSIGSDGSVSTWPVAYP